MTGTFTASITDKFGTWDGKTDHFRVSAAELAIWQAQRDLENARMSLADITTVSDEAFEAKQQQLEELKNAARDVEMALAAAIAKLTKMEAA